MEKYNLNEGNDALKRVLLMMKYDAKKTLTENVEEIEEQNRGTAATAGAVGGAGLAAGAATAAGYGALSTTAGLSSMSLGMALLPASASATAALATGAAVLGGAAGLGLVPLAYWLITKDDGKTKVDRMFQYCSTDKSKIDKIPRQVNDNIIRNISDKIYDATEGLGTDEEAIYSAFGELKTASDFCALVARFNRDYGDLLETLDDDIDDQSEWEKIYRPLRNCVEDSLLLIKDDNLEKDCKQNPNQAKCKGGGGGGGGKKPSPKFRDCKGTYTQGCKSGVIKKVQGCLNVKPDGLFGPKTQGALESKGFKNGFTDADVDKICVANVVVQPTPPISQEDQYGYNTGNQQGQKPPFDSTVSNISVDKLDSI